MIVRSTDELAQLVRARREELGISQEALAELTGVHRSFISLFERGRRAGSFKLVLELVHALGMDVDVGPRHR
jgi:transcriptional regulator with XRE-family HTH domain